MATVYITLRKHFNKEGKSPLVMRITKDRKTSTIHLGYDLFPAEWDAKRQRVKTKHPNSVRLNNLIDTKIAEASGTAIEMDTHHTDTSAKVIMKKVKPNSGASFNKQSESYLNKLKEAGKFNEYTADKPRIKHFKEFIGSDIVFPDITVSLLESFKHHLMITLTVGKDKRPIKERTALNHLVVIRSIFSQAINEGAVEKRFYPFGKDGIKIVFAESQKVGLSAEDITKIENVTLENTNHNHARNLFLISYYFGGMRVSDVLRLKWSDFKDNRLHYTMGKNQKPGSLKATDKVYQILGQYESDKRNSNDFIFPELKKLENLNDEFLAERIISENASRIDKFLRNHVAPAAGITHKITMHIARHTIGNIAGSKNISLIMLQKIFRHSKITTTMAYMANFIHKEADDALDTLLNGEPANDNKAKEIEHSEV